MNLDTGEIRKMTPDMAELRANVYGERWTNLSEKEHECLSNINEGLRPEILKKMRLRVPKR